MEANDLKMVFGTIMAAPGMDENVKIDLRINRKTALFLANAISAGLGERKNGSDLLSLSQAVSVDELKSIIETILEKAGLSELHNRISELSAKKRD